MFCSLLFFWGEILWQHVITLTIISNCNDTGIGHQVAKSSLALAVSLPSINNFHSDAELEELRPSEEEIGGLARYLHFFFTKPPKCRLCCYLNGKFYEKQKCVWKTTKTLFGGEFKLPFENPSL